LDTALPPAKWLASGQAPAQHSTSSRGRPRRRAARPGHRDRADGRPGGAFHRVGADAADGNAPTGAGARGPDERFGQMGRQGSRGCAVRAFPRGERQGRAPHPSPLLCPRRPPCNDEPPTSASRRAVPCRAFRPPTRQTRTGNGSFGVWNPSRLSLHIYHLCS